METIWNVGITVNIFFQSLGAWLKTPMELFSFLGNEYFFLFLLPALYWSVDAGIGLRVGFILLLSTSVNDAFKLALHGPRPYWYSSNVIGYAQETSFGVPSGHSQNSAAIWGMMAATARKWWAWLIAILIVLFIGISRLYLGVHFPHDVLLGWLLGGLVLWATLYFWKPVSIWAKKLSLGKQILAAFLAGLTLILFSLIPFLGLKVTNWQPPQAWAQFATEAVSLSGALTAGGTMFGLLAGLAWFNSQGGFSADGPAWKRIVRFLLGLVGVIVFYLGLDILFGLIAPDAEALLPYILRFVRYAIIGFWVSAGAPWLFVRLKLAEKSSK
jgi:membrane-associated phospholipid phosphatase